jgi:hypothetical protein
MVSPGPAERWEAKVRYGVPEPEDVGLEQLQRNRAVQADLAHLVEHSNAAPAELLDQLLIADALQYRSELYGDLGRPRLSTRLESLRCIVVGSASRRGLRKVCAMALQSLAGQTRRAKALRGVRLRFGTAIRAPLAFVHLGPPIRLGLLLSAASCARRTETLQGLGVTIERPRRATDSRHPLRTGRRRWRRSLAGESRDSVF